MANIKSALKRAKTSEARHAANVAAKSALKTSIRKAEADIADGGEEAGRAALISVYRSLDTAASKGRVHKNKAARKKSRLAKRLNASLAAK